MLQIYCDGSCPKQHGVGGWAFVILFENGDLEEGSGFAAPATNNTMELSAALFALRRVRKLELYQKPLVIVSDSSYVVNGLTTWHAAWEAREFEGVKNLNIWKRLYKHKARCAEFDARWIKGHNGHYWNEYVDQMAGAAQRRGLIELTSSGVIQ